MRINYFITNCSYRLAALGSLTLGLMLLAVHPSFAQTNYVSPEKQIKAAVSPAPASLQDGAKVLGYNKNGELVVLREGSNKLICLADDPGKSNFHVACYHKDLEPFMKRGRELKAQGKSRKERDEIRWQEIKSGKLELPRKPMALYSLTGPTDAFDYSTGKVVSASPLYVIYIPFATEASTGLSTRPASKGAPWIMEPGTPWAHIMVMTGRKISEERP
ncbi:MAG TPA: hypothetical protein VFG39_00905 [Balneolaceae bacterium]|nr:hypothetical protein [Balneolaceae bacterium]